MKSIFFQAKNWEVEYLKSSLSSFGLEVEFVENHLDINNLPDKKDYEIISVFVGCAVNKDVIDSFPNLKLITTRSTGFDHIDVAYAKSKGIEVGFVPSYGENTVAEFAFGLILTVSRKIYQGIDRIKETGDFSFDGLEGFDLKGKTLGVIGTGKIGKHLIKMAKGFDMNIVAFDVFPNNDLAKEFGFEYKTLDELLAISDVISIHVPYLPTTHHLINKENILKIKKGAILINTARGAIVETEALVQALRDKIISGAGLDVLEEEGITKDEMGFVLRNSNNSDVDVMAVLANHVLMEMPNVVITPHNAFNTKEALVRILDNDVENIKQFVSGGKPKDGVK